MRPPLSVEHYADALTTLAAAADTVDRSLTTPGSDPNDIADKANALTAAEWSTTIGMVRLARNIAISGPAEGHRLIAMGLSEGNPILLSLGCEYAARCLLLN